MCVRLHKYAFILFTTLSLTACSSGNSTSSNNTSITTYQNWVVSLTASEYNVVQGNVFLMQNTDCPMFVAIFNSCFGQNPASPYIIPQPPIESSYVDPYYAESLNTQGPNGLANIFYRLSDNEALITLVSYPPEAAYLGYQSYVFTGESTDYVGVETPRKRTLSPDPSRYDIFASIGNDINNIIVANQYGSSPWGGKIIMYITTSNESLANNLLANATVSGINPQSIFIEPIGANVITGNESVANDLLTLIRYAVPQDTAAATNWQNSLSSNVMVYKVTNANIAVSRYATNQYTAHVVNTSELPLSTALGQLADLLQNYLKTNQHAILDAVNYQTIATTVDNVDGIPESGLVGSACIQEGTDCEGDNQDTSTYATLTESSLILAESETAFIVGVNHSVPGVNNNRYVSVDIYNAANSSGVAGSSQTNVNAVGFASGVLTGSAEQVLIDLGITIPSEDAALSENIADLYVTFIARDCNNQTINTASTYCIDLMGTSLIPESAPISVTERSYVVPGITTGGYVPEMVYPYIIAGKHNFISD